MQRDAAGLQAAVIHLKKNIRVLFSCIIILLVAELGYGSSSDSNNTSLYNVTFISEPVGAAVFINGEFNNNTPVILRLATGEYQIEVAYQGYKNFSKNYSVTGDEKYLIKLNKLEFTKNDFVVYVVISTIAIGVIVGWSLFVYYRHKSINNIYYLENKPNELESELNTYKDTKLEEISKELELYKDTTKKLRIEKSNLISEKSDLEAENNILKSEKSGLQKSLRNSENKNTDLQTQLEDLNKEKANAYKKLEDFEQIFDTTKTKKLRGNFTSEQDFNDLYSDFNKEKKVLEDIYALEVLEPLFNYMGDVYTNADIHVIKGYPAYSPKKVFEILKDIYTKLDKNAAFMQCLRALKYRYR